MQKINENANQNKHFASDNYAGVHKEVLDAIREAASAHEVAYGDDPFTADLQNLTARLFGPNARAYPVFNGTAANVLALQSLLPRWGAVICADTAHINVDEGGAPERVGGLKLLPVKANNGKLNPDLIAQEAWGFGDVHRAQPLAVSISQSTELGTVYTRDEIFEISEFTKKHSMRLHIDGSRIANAAAHTGLTLLEMTTELGVDAVSLGGTKNGALGAEAVILTHPKNNDIEFLRKMNLQLASKMRFLSAQLLALYSGDLWLRSAKHANSMAQLMRKMIEERITQGCNRISITRPVESNAVFVKLDQETAVKARERFKFYDWPAGKDEYRLMCSFDTTAQEVEELVELITTA